MPRIRLTDKTVEHLPKPAPKKQVDYWDTYFPAFGVRASYSGSKAWICQPRVLRKGRWVPTRLTIGRYPSMKLADARQFAGELMVMAKDGKDPRTRLHKDKAEIVERSAATFEKIGERFMAEYVARRGLRTNTSNVYRWALNGKDVEAWQDRPVSEITRADVQAVIDGIINRGAPVMAKRTLRYLRKFFEWSESRGLIETVPTDRIVTDVVERSRDRVLTAAEIVEVWRACEAVGGAFGDAFRLLLLTGQRRAEVCGMTWGELQDLKGNSPLWSIPGDRTKNHRPHWVPLSPQAVTIIKDRPRIKGCRFVFSTNGETPISGYSKAVAAVRNRIASARRETGIDEDMPNWVLHDLRRTVATRMVENLHVEPHHVEAVLNHVSGHKAGVAGIYNKAVYADAKRSALNAWGNYVAELLGKDRGNIVELRGRS